MDDSFEIPVTYNGQEISFTARLLAVGYIHKILVNIYGEEVAFEPDEEGLYRATTVSTSSTATAVIDYELLKEIAATIQMVRS